MSDLKYEYGCEITSTSKCPLREEIRAEAIEECIKFIKEHSGEHYIDCDGYFGGQRELVFNIDDWIDDLEQLKENK